MAALLVVVIILAMPSALFFYMQWKCAGKMLCFFLEEDISAVPVLSQMREDFVEGVDGLYDILPERVRLFRYPLGWPRPLQQIVPASLYERGNAVPLDWLKLGHGQYTSAMELKAVLDPHWLKNLVQGAREGGVAASKWEKMIPLLSLAVSVIVLIMMFVLMTKIH